MKSLVAQNPFAFEAEVCLESRIERLCWSQQGAALLASTASGELILFDENGSVCNRWTGHDGRIIQIGLSCNNDFVASAGVDTATRLWSLADVGKAVELERGGSLGKLAWSPWSRVLLTSRDQDISLWAQSGALVERLSEHSLPVVDLCWHPVERNIFASCASDGIFVWELGSSKSLYHLNGQGDPTYLRFNRLGSILAYACRDSSVRVWVVGSGIVLQLNGAGEIKSLDWSWGGRWLAICSEYSAYVWKFDDRRVESAQPTKLNGPTAPLTSMAFHPFEHLLACGDQSGAVYVWRTDLGNRTAPVVVARGQSAVTALAWNPFKNQLAVSFYDGSLRFWSSEFK